MKYHHLEQGWKCNLSMTECDSNTWSIKIAMALKWKEYELILHSQEPSSSFELEGKWSKELVVSIYNKNTTRNLKNKRTFQLMT